MSPIIGRFLIAAVALCATASTAACADAPGAIVVRVEGLAAREGVVALAVYDSKTSFKERADPVRKARLAATGPEVEWTVEGLPAGEYAIAVYHDLNDNGELDKGAMGVPQEPYGFSNDARGTFGPPKYRKASVAFDGKSAAVSIRVR